MRISFTVTSTAVGAMPTFANVKMNEILNNQQVIRHSQIIEECIWKRVSSFSQAKVLSPLSKYEGPPRQTSYN